MKEKIISIPLCKRIFDVLFSLIVLVLLSPLMFIISVALLCTQGTPIFFKQERPGLEGRLFKLIKFRTMQNHSAQADNLLADEYRITGLGRFLRRTSLDELPEFINVLVGNMSVVGPRPLLVQYLERYNPEQARRHDVLPGVTGWAQIHGRNALTWEDKFKLDVWYVDHWSFWLDVRIILITIWKVLRREGISQPGHATMPEFLGSATEKKD
jgi:sugar transferase EpsL